jgi:hypothetical protein
MLILDDIYVEDDILTTFFSCDINKCKGACCTFYGDWGAPLADHEIGIMQKHFDTISKYLSYRSIQTIKKNGFYEGKPGDYTTVCINKKDCVFVYYNDDIAYCAYETAYLEGKIDFRKPISCHLYPIRVSSHNHNKYLYYQRIDECINAREKGNLKKISLFTTVEEALTRAFGKKWTNDLKEVIKLKSIY